MLEWGLGVCFGFGCSVSMDVCLGGDRVLFDRGEEVWLIHFCIWRSLMAVVKLISNSRVKFWGRILSNRYSVYAYLVWCF